MYRGVDWSRFSESIQCSTSDGSAPRRAGGSRSRAGAQPLAARRSSPISKQRALLLPWLSGRPRRRPRLL
jgi:hypothetical protein